MSANAAVAYPSTLGEMEMRLSEEARGKMAELMAQADADVSAIRVFVSGGGCGGMSYGMTYAAEQAPHDSVLDGEGYRILVDPVALSYLQGCEIDFVNDGLNATFVFNNVFQAVGGSGGCAGCGGGGF